MGTSGCATYILGSGAIALIVAIVFHRLVEAPVLTALNRKKFGSFARSKKAGKAVHDHSVSTPAVISGTSDPA
jgi:peptidoglycan/LPS O-acetylase OafA/YrhL